MPKSDKQLSIEKAYSRQRRRLTRFVKNAEKRGYHFPENAIPPKPKRITEASVNRLAQLTPDKLYKKATATLVEYVPGEGTNIRTVSGTEKRHAERSQAAKLGRYTKQTQKAKQYNDEVHQTQAEQQPAVEYQPDPEAYLSDEAEEPDTFTQYTDEGIAFEPSQQGVPASETVQHWLKESTDPETGEVTQSFDEWYDTWYDSSGRAEIDEQQYQEAIDGRYLQGEMILNNLQDRIEVYSGYGYNALSGFLAGVTEQYGREAVALGLADMEAENPELIEYAENMVVYKQYATANQAGRTFHKMADVIKHSVKAQRGEFSDELYHKMVGSAMESLEVYKD